VAAYRRAVALRDQHATAWNNLGLAYTAQNELAQADAAFSRAIALEPRFAAAHWNRGIALLAAGRYEDGWPEYEWRLAVRDFNDAATAPRAPRWKGEPIAGARILLRAEQGLGDTIQAVRFARDLHEAGMSVLARIPRKLERLVRTVPGIADVSCDDEPWPAVDAEIRIMSVPGALKVTRETVPSPIPYMAVDTGKRRAAEHAVRARAGTRRSIGLAWAGSPDNANDRRRSAPLSLFAPLLARPDIEWFSLQHDDEHAVAAVTDATALHRIEERIDFDGMAAMIDVLDLVISVDTSVVHVAGALARPVWILLPFAPDWRWGVSGASTPWYPTARLFRQPRTGDWTAVIDAVGRALDELR
jgi:tetratricopeptide (TPR) repeat protein